MVTDDSAIFVARITFTTPSLAGMNTFCCSSCGIVEWSGMTSSFSYKSGSVVSSRMDIADLISSHPGRKQRMLPFLPASVSSAATCFATSMSN